jgi:hypothetical protein
MSVRKYSSVGGGHGNCKSSCLFYGSVTGCLQVYFYHVPSWKHFSIKEYGKKIIIGKHPITNIVVRETKRQRKFFITSSFNIHEVVGFSSNF